MRRSIIIFCIFSIITIEVSPLWGQNGIRDSLIDESILEFFTEYGDFIKENDKWVFDIHTLPIDYKPSSCNVWRNVGFVDFSNNKKIKRYKNKKKPIPTVSLQWRIIQDGTVMFKVLLSYVTIDRKSIKYAFSDMCVYYYKYSDDEKRWKLYSKMCGGI